MDVLISFLYEINTSIDLHELAYFMEKTEGKNSMILHLHHQEIFLFVYILKQNKGINKMKKSDFDIF